MSERVRCCGGTVSSHVEELFNAANSTCRVSMSTKISNVIRIVV